MNIGIIVLLAVSSVIALALIAGIAYYMLKIQKNKKQRESLAAKKYEAPENVEVDNIKECPNKI